MENPTGAQGRRHPRAPLGESRANLGLHCPERPRGASAEQPPPRSRLRPGAGVGWWWGSPGVMELRPTRAWDTAGPTSERALLGRDSGQASHHSSQQPVLRPHLPGTRTPHAQPGSHFPSALPAWSPLTHRHPKAAYGIRGEPNSVPARALGGQALARLCPHPVQSLPECCRLPTALSSVSLNPEP